MDLGTAREQVYGRLGMAQTDGQLTPQFVNQLLQVALRTIAVERDWEWLQATEVLTTALGVNYVTPLAGSASTVTWTRTTHLTGAEHGHAITQIPWSDFRDRNPSVQGTLPDVFAVQLGRLYLHPTPSGSATTLNHDFIMGETTLTNDSDSPLLPDQYAGAWVEKASELCARRVNDYQTAQVCAGEYKQWLQSLDAHRRRSAGPYRVSVRPGGFL